MESRNKGEYVECGDDVVLQSELIDDNGNRVAIYLCTTLPQSLNGPAIITQKAVNSLLSSARQSIFAAVLEDNHSKLDTQWTIKSSRVQPREISRADLVRYLSIQWNRGVLLELCLAASSPVRIQDPDKYRSSLENNTTTPLEAFIDKHLHVESRLYFMSIKDMDWDKRSQCVRTLFGTEIGGHFVDRQSADEVHEESSQIPETIKCALVLYAVRYEVCAAIRQLYNSNRFHLASSRGNCPSERGVCG